MVSETTANGSRERTQRTVALDQSALLEVLDALTAAEVDDRIRQATQTIYLSGLDRSRAHPRDRRCTTPAHRRPSHPAQRPSAPRVNHDGGGSGAADPQAAGGVVVPQLVGAPPPGRPGVVRGDHGGYLHGVSTRKVDDLVKALGADSGISKTEVSRICADLDSEVAAFRDRWPARPSRTSLSTPPTARPGSTAALSPKRWSWPPGCAVTAGGRSSALGSVTPRMAPSGPSSSAA